MTLNTTQKKNVANYRNSGRLFQCLMNKRYQRGDWIFALPKYKLGDLRSFQNLFVLDSIPLICLHFEENR